MEHAFNDQKSQTALGLSLRSWWFVWQEGKNAGKTRTKFFVISGADPGIFDGYGEWGGGGGGCPNFGSERTVELFCGK